jgi:hypothetical protein
LQKNKPGNSVEKQSDGRAKEQKNYRGKGINFFRQSQSQTEKLAEKRGRSIIFAKPEASLAQLVEQLIRNEQVASSSLVGGSHYQGLN